MAVVAVAACLSLAARFYYLRSIASYHRGQIRGMVTQRMRQGPWYEDFHFGIDKTGRPLTEREKAVDRWHGRLGQKYGDAAYYPWRPVPPDPPPPE
jgi:hypothetical protein